KVKMLRADHSMRGRGAGVVGASGRAGWSRNSHQKAPAKSKPPAAKIARLVRQSRANAPIKSVATISGAHAPPARPASVPTRPCTVVRIDSGNQLWVTLLRFGYTPACVSPKPERAIAIGTRFFAQAMPARLPDQVAKRNVSTSR